MISKLRRDENEDFRSLTYRAVFEEILDLKGAEKE